MINNRFNFGNRRVDSCLRNINTEFLHLRIFDLRQERLTEDHEKLEMHGFVLSAEQRERYLARQELVVVGIAFNNL